MSKGSRQTAAPVVAAKPRPGSLQPLQASIGVTGIPEALAAMRREMAACLRTEADRGWEAGQQNAVDMAVRASLLRVADVFEAGLGSADDIEVG